MQGYQLHRLFYDINFERISPLVIHPPAVNSYAFEDYSYFEMKKTLENLKNNVKQVNGTLSVVFKNSDFKDSQKDGKILDLIKELKKYPKKKYLIWIMKN